MKRDVLGLHIVGRDQPDSEIMARVRAQLRAADALVTVERDQAEPEAVRAQRRQAEDLLTAGNYEAAAEAFLHAIETGLAQDHFVWQAALNLVNCHRLLGNLDEAEGTADQLGEMFEARPDHPIHFLLATQLGAIAADRFTESGQAAYAGVALAWAQAAYDWQVEHRAGADALRAYNLVVALLRLGRNPEALDVFHRHEQDEEFQRWCAQGDRAEEIRRLVGD